MQGGFVWEVNVMDANNNAIVAIMEQNWKSWAMVTCRCTF
jgi:hypothetical protein